MVNCSATTESKSKVSSTMRSIIIGRPSTTTTPQPDDDDEVSICVQFAMHSEYFDPFFVR